MLVNFSVENFRSFGAEQTLSLVASKAHTGHEEHCVPIPTSDRHVLRTSVIYGANAAGKSNVVRAMDFARDLILEGPGPMKRISLNQFRFTTDAKKPSSFEFRFVAANRVFVYGFDVSREAVESEWLTATNDRGKEVDLFERKDGKIAFGDFGKFDPDDAASGKAIEALLVLGVRDNQLLLNKIFDLSEEKRGGLLNAVIWWFSHCLTIVPAEASFSRITEYLDENEEFRKFASEFLSTIGTGIGKLQVEQTYIDREQLPEALVEGLDEGEAMHIPFPLSAGMSLQLDPEDSSRVIRRNVTSTHSVDGADYSLPFAEESDGTQRFLNLLPALFHLQSGCKVFVIDELDRSLHPLLAHAMIKYFSESCVGACQLIVTTHETHLLDRVLLRRDEVWFAEKDERQQTHLYSLTDMKIRKDLRIEKSYLQGRFGAIPFVGDIERLHRFIESHQES